ncbi:interleukin-3 receptor class 2 subunit beta-like isoform X1 [Carassius gibelio]|uniref:interleukin-3 receptor class 2 subunit beta-like isoform X1 n=2 Tax=Carassius gibelio TaxID=101364 RepID=UPI0022789C1E|nr:interleukin-3 receptor class 2 subunit beta-like isoform X1 [Carassius gibelio]
MCGNLQTQEHREDRQNHTLCAQLLDFQMHTGMKTLAMMMMMMMSSYSALSDQSLKCYNDFYNTFTCVWDTSNLDVIPPIRPETECWITVSVEKRSTRLSNLEKKEAALIADPMQPHIRSATVVFQSKRGIIISIAELHEEVRCKNYTNPVAEIAKHKAAVSAVKVAPPQKVDVLGGNVSWSCDSLKPYLDAEFGVQYRSAAQSWKDVEEIIVKTTELELELPKDDLLLNHQYVIRVRVRYDLPNAVWSDWSEEYSWTSDVGQTPQTAGLKCYNDYYNTFTCVWDTSNLDVIPPIRPETECWITVSVEKRSTRLSNLEKKDATLIADPMQPHIRSATVVFQSKRGIIISIAELHEEVRCKNYTNPVAEIAKHKAAVSAVKVAPPQKVDVHGGNVSWSCDSLIPFLDAEFGVQYRSAAQSWKDVEEIIIKTTEPELELPKDDLLLNHQYVIRVRVRYDLPNAVWSDWSEEYSWTSDVGQTPQTAGNTHLSDIIV